MADETLEQQLAALDDAALLAVVNKTLAARNTAPQNEQERADDDFYRSLYPRDDGRGPRVIRDPDDES